MLDEIPDVCSSCFKVMLKSLGSRSRNQEEGNRAFSPSRSIKKHFQWLVTASTYNHFAHHENISLVRSYFRGKTKS